MVIDGSEQIEKFKEFLEQDYEKELYVLNDKGDFVLIIDFSKIIGFDHELADQLLEDPEETVRSIELSTEGFNLKQQFRVRISNLPKSQFKMIKDIRSNDLDRFLYVEGIVRQASDVRPQVTSAKFECPSCGNVISILQLDSKFKEPSRCSCGRRGKFRLLSKILVDAQRLVIEEIPEYLEGGEQPKRLSVFLKEDLVEPRMEKRTTPGSKVRITGIVKEVPILLKTGAQSIRYDLAMESNYIESMEELFEDLDMSKEEEEEIKNLGKNPKIYDMLVNSIAPQIRGHIKVKEAIILQLMGGVSKNRTDGTKTRGDIHILLVGDPGTAKSTLISSLSKVVPKSRMVSGKSATGAGITASVVKDEFLRGWALEAGAIVLANGGYLFIDELDKMSPEDRNALHEGLEQQRISISKANIQAVLKAETTVLAAANPKLGRFDPYTPIASQIDLPSTLINRFDLIFPIRDLPNREEDEKIASHVLSLHKKPEEIKPELPKEVFRRYISYIKRKIKPVLTDSAIDEIKKFYVDLRNKGTSSEGEIKPIPISARQLEALVRLAEGSAKVRLSNKVLKQDARRSINILKHCLMQVGFDYETGQIDIDRITTGITTSQRSRIFTIREIIKSLEEKFGKKIPLEEVIAEAANKGIDESHVEESIERLKREGEIFEPVRNSISRV
ncbi:MAG: minichromosome maintenance protein MCM [Nanoarchaeota archaeon]|nr:minichromosome maintenance protein MCM [Nanoarchaeota archaeon]